jgi:Flp pilus assembly CpaE family ATPase
VVREVLSAAQRGSDVVVLDLPRDLSGVASEMVPRCDQVVLVAETTVLSVAAAGKVVAHLRGAGPDPGLVVRGSGASVAPETVASALGLPLLADYPSRRRVTEQVDLGLGPAGSRRSPLARAARSVLAGARQPLARPA